MDYAKQVQRFVGEQLSDGAGCELCVMCKNIKCIKHLWPQWFSALSAPFLLCALCRPHGLQVNLKRTAAGSKSPTWIWYNLQLKLDLWPPSNHCIDIGIFLGNSLYSEGVLVSICCDHVFVATGNVLCVALPFYFSVGLLGLCFKDHRGPLSCLLSLWFLGKCWNWKRRSGFKIKGKLFEEDVGCNQIIFGGNAGTITSLMNRRWWKLYYIVRKTIHM